MALPVSPGAGGQHRVLALLSEEPAGRISTRNAGTISFSATLSWRPGGGMPTDKILNNPAPGARFYSFVQTDDAASATRHVFCEIRALHTKQLTGALDAVLRFVTDHAALTEAVLEAQAIRLASPSVAPAALVEELARQMLNVGFPVSFGPSWTPAFGADVSVGVRGLDDASEAFLGALSAWRTPTCSR